MILIDFLFALVIAVVMTTVVAGFFGRRGFPRAGVFPNFLFLFVLLLLMTWAGGVWIVPFGPVLYGRYWVPFAMVGFVFAVLLAALLPPMRRPRSVEEAAEQERQEETSGLALGVFFWVVILLLALSITVHYV